MMLKGEAIAEQRVHATCFCGSVQTALSVDRPEHPPHGHAGNPILRMKELPQEVSPATDLPESRVWVGGRTLRFHVFWASVKSPLAQPARMSCARAFLGV